MENKIIIEPCVEDFVGVQRAIFMKAKRVEICSKLEDGGLSPEIELVEILLKRKVKPVVMLRTNASWTINEQEMIELKDLVGKYLKIGVKEFIFGWIKDKDIDYDACNEIIAMMKKDCKWCFHRAIDQIGNYDVTLENLKKMGFSRVLTSGGPTGGAMDNLDTIRYIVEKHNSKIKIVVGGGVNKDNIEEIREKTGVQEFHGTRVLW